MLVCCYINKVAFVRLIFNKDKFKGHFQRSYNFNVRKMTLVTAVVVLICLR